MKIDQAKALLLPALLAKLGHSPVHTRDGEHWYCSPLREEQEASFKLSRDGKAWYDHGLGQGGNLLAFAMTYFQADLRGALHELEQLQGTSSTLPSPPSPLPSVKPDVPEASMTVTKIAPVTSRALKQYLQQRGIPLNVASPYLQELHYTREGKPYFALAFANERGGYELRNPYFKGTHGPKDITLLQPETGKRSAVALFEGFMDFLSAVVLTGRQPQMPVIVMNSTAMKERTIEVIQGLGVATAYLYLDRDEAGRRLTAALQAALSGVAVEDKSRIYAGQKDLNAWMTAEQSDQAALAPR